MGDAGEALLRLLGAWNEGEASARDAILDETLGEGFRYEDPHAPAPFEGRDGMAEYLGVFRDSLPDATLLPQGRAQVTHGTAMARARIDRAGTPFARLVFVGATDGDRLVRVAGFVESE